MIVTVIIALYAARASVPLVISRKWDFPPSFTDKEIAVQRQELACPGSRMWEVAKPEPEPPGKGRPLGSGVAVPSAGEGGMFSGLLRQVDSEFQWLPCSLSCNGLALSLSNVGSYHSLEMPLGLLQGHCMLLVFHQLLAAPPLSPLPIPTPLFLRAGPGAWSLSLPDLIHSHGLTYHRRAGHSQICASSPDASPLFQPKGSNHPLDFWNISDFTCPKDK